MSKKIIAGFCFLFIIVAFLDIGEFVINARQGLMLFGLNVLPILFPFFFITGLLIELDIFKSKKSRFSFLIGMSYLAGFPTSARMISQMHTRGQITTIQAKHIATATTTTSPIFIIATVGASLYCDIRLGILIFIAHILGAVLTGATFLLVKSLPSRCSVLPLQKGDKSDRENTLYQNIPSLDIPDAINKSLTSSVQNILNIGGLIIVFFILSAALPLPFAAITEMTTGVFFTESIANGLWRAIIPTAIISFGGLCLAMQGLPFLRTFDVNLKFYFAYKIVHTVLATTLCIALYFIFY